VASSDCWKLAGITVNLILLVGYFLLDKLLDKLNSYPGFLCLLLLPRIDLEVSFGGIFE
jgi:hypothetical protein